MSTFDKTWRERFTEAYGLYTSVRFLVTVAGFILHLALLLLGIDLAVFEEAQVNDFAKLVGIVGIVLGVVIATNTSRPTERQMRWTLRRSWIFGVLFLACAAISHSAVVDWWAVLAPIRETMIRLGWTAVILIGALYGIAVYNFVKWLGIAFRAKPAAAPPLKGEASAPAAQADK